MGTASGRVHWSVSAGCAFLDLPNGTDKSRQLISLAAKEHNERFLLQRSKVHIFKSRLGRVYQRVRPVAWVDIQIDNGTPIRHVDQALVTGESVPVPKKVNDCVFAGTLNTTGVLKIAVTKKATETLVSRIVQLVVESQKRKASIERLVDRFAKIYVPIVIALAVFTAGALPYLLGGTFQTWFYRSLILLVVSCPSAFIISVPETVFIAITIAARRGVIIKGGVFIEKLAQVKSVVFYKTPSCISQWRTSRIDFFVVR